MTSKISITPLSNIEYDNLWKRKEEHDINIKKHEINVWSNDSETFEDFYAFLIRQKNHNISFHFFSNSNGLDFLVVHTVYSCNLKVCFLSISQVKKTWFKIFEKTFWRISYIWIYEICFILDESSINIV